MTNQDKALREILEIIAKYGGGSLPSSLAPELLNLIREAQEMAVYNFAEDICNNILQASKWFRLKQAIRNRVNLFLADYQKGKL